MVAYPPDSTVTVCPFSHRVEGEEATIANLDKEIFLAIPVEGLDILQHLAAGQTVGETVRLYEKKYGETPDIEDFLDALTMEGFLDAQPHASVRSHHHRIPPGRLSWGLNRVTPAAARVFIGIPAMILYAVIVAFGLYIAFTNFDLVPNGTALLFPHDFALLTWLTIILAFVGLLTHELGHMIAARAYGVPTRIGMGNRIFMIVAETDMTGIWLAPKRQRYTAFLFGPVIDLVTTSLMLITVWAHKQGTIHLPSFWLLLVNGVLFTNLMRLMFQTFMFIRTDLYYVIATAFHANNLMADTEDMLRNVVNRMRRAYTHVIDQSRIPPKEKRLIRTYAVIWIIGRFLAGTALITYTIPVLFGYYTQIFYLLTGQPTRFGSLDFITVFIIGVVLESLGIYLWLRSIYRAYAQRKREREVRLEKQLAARTAALEGAAA